MTSAQVTREMFAPVDSNAEQAEAISRPSLTYWQDSWRRLRKNKTAIAGLVVLIVITIAALAFPARSSWTSRRSPS